MPAVLVILTVMLLIALLYSEDQGAKSVALSIAYIVTVTLMVGYSIWR